MNLYEMNREMENVLLLLEQTADQETGEVNSEMLEELNQLQMERDEKLENIGIYIKRLTYEVNALQSEQAVLNERIKQKKKAIDGLKNYVSGALLDNGQTKFETSRVVYSFRRSTKVKVDESLLPKKYWVKTIEERPDKTGIGELLKKGQKVKGAELVESMNLQIK